MKVYTRTGDDGTTGLFGGGRVSKADLRVEAYGTVDELNAVLGLARTAAPNDERMDGLLAELQNELFVLGSDLATPITDAGDGPYVMRMQEGAAARLETIIDGCEEDLAPLKNFILPGGCPQAAQLHLARTVCRRAERLVVAFGGGGTTLSPEVLIYLNRLSDLLFVLGRWANHRADEPEVLWKPRG
jgi:cob(I)alamin adenosyltransferase